ncbi:MAG: hypothetical protein JO223_07705 [Hyphomicrobiales bacterium]|nr:hypothetical protein [Hyphomicrobiales bacterium]MBV8442283.1 hypothetical protein [Hyphomicrobiales bacterium]
MSEPPDNVDLNWIAGNLLALRSDVRALKDDMDVLSAVLRRVNHNQTSFREELRALFDQHRSLRERVAGLEDGAP